MNKKLAVLIPVHNGGKLLFETVVSCSNADLHPSQYEIIVVDNCSTDGALDSLPKQDKNGAPIKIYKNEKNLGRVGNWNRAIKIATEEGFTYATFLFIGDTWLPNGSLPQLLKVMDKNEIVVSCASFEIHDIKHNLKSKQRVFVLEKKFALIDSKTFVKKCAEIGALAFGPPQANIYRLFKTEPLFFQSDNPTLTDQEATAYYLLKHQTKVLLTNQPFSAWRSHPNRFHHTMDFVTLINNDLNLLKKIQRALSISVNEKKVNSYILMRYGHVWIKNIKILIILMKQFILREGGIDFFYFFILCFRKLFKKNRLDFHLKERNVFDIY